MSKSKNRPILGITMGDPKGIGPEVILKALRSREIHQICHPIVFGDPRFFNWRKASRLTNREAGRLAGFFIEQATHSVLKGEINAIVTAPISKENLQRAGYKYPGHTEFLAALSDVREIRMMMAGPTLKVVLVTIHDPIKKVAASLTRRSILRTIEIADRSLRQMFGIPRPRIAVAALNPHAGEEGIFGSEEKKVIAPAISAARRKKIIALGPFSPDTVFRRAASGEFDLVVAMYHDQGLIPLKMLHFDSAVNITLGLPFIRTSVDHGTAFDIAGRGIADPRSMIAAIQLAVTLIQGRE